MNKLKNKPKEFSNRKEYQLESANIRGNKVPKSFWQRMSKKAKLTIIGTLALVTVAAPSFSNAISESNYPTIPPYAITETDIDSNDSLSYWLNEYNNTNDKGAKRYIMTKIADYSDEIEDMGLDTVKEIILNEIKENPRESDYIYNKIDEASDVRVSYSVDHTGRECYMVTDNRDNNLNVELTDNMKDIIKEVAKLQTVTKNDKNNKEEIGRQALKVIKENSELKHYEFDSQNKENRNGNQLKITEKESNDERDEI